MSDVPFGELLAEPLRNGVSYPSRTRGSGVRMFNMREIFAHDRLTADVDCERVPLTADEQRTARLQSSDLLFARQSLTYEGAGKVALVLDESSPTWDSHLIRARLDLDKADPAFYYYFFRSSEGRRRIETIIQQVAAAGIRGSELARLLVPSPPRRAQQAIAEVLGALDDKIAANNSFARSAELLAQTVYDIAEQSVQRQPMSRILKPILGGTPSRETGDYWGGSELWVSARDITAADASVIVDTDEHITATAVIKTKAKPLPAGSVILTARGTVGKVARLAAPASFNQSCYGFVPGALPSSILYFAIRSATDHAKAISHGSVFDTITMGTFDHLQIAEFDRLAMASLEAELRPLLDTVTFTVLENRTLAATRDALLPQLMSGKLRIRDAESAASAAGA